MALPLVQQAVGSATVSPCAVSLGVAPSNGNILVASIALPSSADSVTNIVQTGVSWSKAAGSNSNADCEIWVGVVGDGASTSISITTNVGAIAANVAEFNGYTGVQDVSGVPATGLVSTAPATGTITTLTAGDLVIAAASITANTATATGPSNSFTGLTQSNSTTATLVASAYQVEAARGSYSTAWTVTNAGTWDAIIIALKANVIVAAPPPNAAPIPGKGQVPPFFPFERGISNPAGTIQAGYAQGAPLAAPTVYYVRTTGSNAANGLTPATAWQTFTKALTTAVPNSIIYIGAGVYRETVSITITPTVAGPVQVIGDVTGAYTGDVGMVQLTAYTTNDKTAPSATTLLNLNGRSNIAFSNIFFVGGTANAIVTATTATSQNVTFTDCAFSLQLVTAAPAFRVTNTGGVPFTWLVDRCIFFGAGIAVVTLATAPSDYDGNFLIRNSLSFAAQTTVVNVTATGALTGKGGGVRLRNSSIIASEAAGFTTLSASLSTVFPCLVSNNFMYIGSGNTAMNATTLGQIVENWNEIASTTPRTNVAIGANSDTTPYAPLFHFGQERIWGGTQRPFGEPMQSSPLRAFGAQDVTAGFLDNRQGPRPSLAAMWDVGAFQRGNSAVQTTSVVHTGSNAIQIVGDGWQDFDVPVSAVATTLSLWLQYDSNYVGPLPQIQVVKGGQVGVGNYAVPVSNASLNTWQQYSITINPTAAGIITLRIVSGDTSGVGNVYCDSFAAV